MRIFITAFCFLFVIAACSAQARDKVLDIQTIISPGGVTAWLVEDHSIPVLAFQFSFKGTGAVNDPADKQGLARLASNTMDEGAGDLDSQAFQKELRDLSIDFHFNASRDHFGGTVKTLTKNKARAFELLTLALTKPRFDADAVERMREANMSRIRSSLTEPDWMAARILNDKAFSGHPYAQNSGGTLTTLKSITAEDLRGFARTLTRDRLYVAVAGDITAAELSTLLDQIFGALPASAQSVEAVDTKLQNHGATYLYRQDIPQTIIEMIQPGIKRTDPDYHIAQVMNYILGASGFGSRLTEEIREKRGLTYGVYSYLMDMDHANSLSVSTSTENVNAGALISLIKQEWVRMKAEPVTDKELADAKAYLIGSLPLSLTSTDDIAGLLLSLQLDDLPIDYLEQREDKIKAATKEDVSRVAQSILNEKAFVTVLVGQPENVENAQEVKTLPNAE